MTDPALVAAIGAGGVLVGAVGGGAVQSLVARTDRRRAGRIAARVLYTQLHGAETAITDLRPRRDWQNMITDWDAFGVAWDKYRDAVANVLTTPEFAIVDSAFACMASLSRAKTRDLAKPAPVAHAPASFDTPDEILSGYQQTVHRATRIVLKASFRYREVRAKQKALTE
ncbi:MAG: hypothetical protein ABR992_06615 [Solirubrobacteraceae bacterium]